MLPDKGIKKRNRRENNQQTPIDSDKERRNKSWKSKLWEFLKVKLKIWGYEGPFIHFLILLATVGVIIIGILYHPSIRGILDHRFVHDGRPVVVSDKNEEVKQSEAGGDNEDNASEPEQIAPIDDKEVKKQPKEVGDTFRDCEVVCPEMVVVPAGNFLMGSPKDDEDRYDNEGLRHLVTISKPFAVGKYEVTHGQYGAFVTASSHKAGTEWFDPGFEQSDKHPVVGVSWDDAKAYIRWLSEQTGRQYRLLSEAEWEYAARAGTTTRYHFGDTIFPEQANYGRNKGGTVAVGSYPANKFGLHDMHGNVWEWVEDCWHNDYGGAPGNGSAWVSNCVDMMKGERRVLRGGSWDSSLPWALRSALRGRVSTRNRSDDLGFRVARTL